MTGKIGMYLRLSDEDENAKESNSIKAQRELIYDFILKDDELSTYEILEFCDDGFSGTNFNRPGALEMLSKANNREIGCIIVKDFSRFGRNYIEVGSFLEEVFPVLGIRFISVNDNFDSSKVPYSGEFISIAFKNLVYDLYSKDLSQKISSVRRIKAEQGNFITAFAPYGYQKTKEQRLVIDKEVAPVVQRIFSMALEGIPKVEIARTLNNEKVPSPLALRKIRKENFSCTCVSDKSIWRTSTISTILKDQRYVGDGVYGKVKPKQVGSGQEKRVPKKDWIIVPNVHDPIIDRVTFEKVNGMFQNYGLREKKRPHPLSKRVRCSACNHIISRKTTENKSKNSAVTTYRCATLDVTDEFGCCRKKIDEKQMEDAILLYLNQLTNVTNVKNYDIDTNEMQKKNIIKMKVFIKKQETELKKLNLAKLRLYEAFKLDKLNKQVFIKKKNEIENQCKEIKSTLALEQNKLEKSYTLFASNSKVHFQPKERMAFESLTKEIIDSFVDAVTIEKNGFIKIYWTFQDMFQS